MDQLAESSGDRGGPMVPDLGAVADRSVGPRGPNVKRNDHRSCPCAEHGTDGDQLTKSRPCNGPVPPRWGALYLSHPWVCAGVEAGEVADRSRRSSATGGVFDSANSRSSVGVACLWLRRPLSSEFGFALPGGQRPFGSTGQPGEATVSAAAGARLTTTCSEPLQKLRFPRMGLSGASLLLIFAWLTFFGIRIALLKATNFQTSLWGFPAVSLVTVCCGFWL